MVASVKPVQKRCPQETTDGPAVTKEWFLINRNDYPGKAGTSHSGHPVQSDIFLHNPTVSQEFCRKAGQ